MRTWLPLLAAGAVALSWSAALAAEAPSGAFGATVGHGHGHHATVGTAPFGRFDGQFGRFDARHRFFWNGFQGYCCVAMTGDYGAAQTAVILLGAQPPAAEPAPAPRIVNPHITIETEQGVTVVRGPEILP